VRARAAALVAALVAAGCGASIPREELPSEPIAFIRQEPKAGIAKLDEFLRTIRPTQFDPDDEVENRAAAKLARTTVALITPSTGEIRALPDAGSNSYPLDWSSDGNFLLIGRSDRSPQGLVLFSWNRLTGASEALHAPPSLGAASFGDGPIRLAHVGLPPRNGQVGEPAIVVRLDQGVEALPDSVGGQQPDVAADGRKVLFVRPPPRGGRDALIVVSEIGAPEGRVIGTGDSPRFSRDGRWIAYVTRRRGNADVWLMRADGTGKRAVAESTYDEEFPAVSPDGRFVVYSAARGENDVSQLFLVQVGNRAEMQLTQNGQNGRPVW
jgi:hypothetical protein